MPTSTLAVLRIVFGVLVLGWTLSLAGDLQAFFGSGGLLSSSPGGRWGLGGAGALVQGDSTVQVLYGVLLVASLALIVG